MALSTCLHRSCGSCIVKWIQREEASGQTTPPTCPFCRSAIKDADVTAILGRSFQPKVAIVRGAIDENNEVDPLTLDWINEHTVPCPGCANRIEKADGCDLIGCLCGFRFCFKCGVADGDCACNPGHDFLEEVEGDSVGYAPIRDRDGFVDFGSCIRRRQVQREREEKEYENEEEYWEELYRTHPSLCTANGRWLFSSKNNARCVGMLTQQLANEAVRAQRRERCRVVEREQSESHASHDVSWLFLSRRSAIRRLGRQRRVRQNKPWVRNMRQRTRRMSKRAEVLASNKDGDLNSVWLFLPRDAGLRVLRTLDEASWTRAGRAESKMKEPEKTSDAEVQAMSGDWLFQHEARADSLCHIMHTYRCCGMFCQRCREESREQMKLCLKGIFAIFPPSE